MLLLLLLPVFPGGCFWARLSVFLGQGQRHSGQKLVHGHMHLRGEVDGEQAGQNHENAVGENL